MKSKRSDSNQEFFLFNINCLGRQKFGKMITPFLKWRKGTEMNSGKKNDNENYNFSIVKVKFRNVKNVHKVRIGTMVNKCFYHYVWKLISTSCLCFHFC
jgi:hypothetical protein